MSTTATCVDCGALLSAEPPENGRCDLCNELRYPAAGTPSDAHPRPASLRARPTDHGRILRTGAHPPTPTQPVGTMARLMTADLQAALTPADPPPPEEAFTLSDEGLGRRNLEEWSLGDAVPPDDIHPSPARSSSALPRVIIYAAAVASLVVLGGLLRTRLNPAPSRSDTNARDQVAADPAVGRETADAPPGIAPGKDPAKRLPSQALRTQPQRETSGTAPAQAPEAHAQHAPTKPAAQDFDGRMREGRAALDEGNLPVALAAFQAAVALRPLSAEAITGVARSQAGGEDTAAAIRSFERAVAANPDYVPAWSGLAHLRETSGDRDGAIDAYRRVIAISPNGREAKTARDALTDLGETVP